MPDALCAVTFALALSCADQTIATPAPTSTPIAVRYHRVRRGLAGWWLNLRDEAAIWTLLITQGSSAFP